MTEDNVICVLTPLLCQKGIALLQKGRTRTLGPEADGEERNGPAVLPLMNFSQVASAPEVIPDSVLVVKSSEADLFCCMKTWSKPAKCRSNTLASIIHMQ